MQKAFFALVVIFVCACNDSDDAAGLLQQPPYQVISDSIEKFPQDAALYYRRGSLLYKDGQKELAESDIKKAWQLAPKEEYGLSLATIYQDKSADTAIAFLQKASQQLPGSISLRIALARGHQAMDRHEEALRISNEVIAAHPNQLDALLLKYELLKSTGKEAEALEVLKTAYSYAPFDPELAHNLAFEYAMSGNEAALQLSDSLIKADVRQAHAEPYYFKALYYRKKGDDARALTLLEDAIRHDYYFIDAHMEKGELHYDRKRYKEALAAFRLVTTISPTYANGYYWLARSEEALGQKKEAKLNYQRAFGLDKTLTEAKTAADRL